ncbi:MAG: tRNA-(ms[2]io[6]A)-hydroxylase [Thermoanaerobaculia bacterium]
MSRARSSPVSSPRVSLHPRLKRSTPPEWLEAVLADFDGFLLDHAACERKASGSALSMLAHYPDRRRLADAMVELACEELDHFARVYRHIASRGLSLRRDSKSAYAHRLAAAFRSGSEAYFLDRLLASGIMEARGCERFGLVAGALPPGPLQDLYRELTVSEARHRGLFVRLARHYFDAAAVHARLEELLDVEAEIVQSLPLRAAVY